MSPESPSPLSLPVVPPQPPDQEYPARALNLFVEFSRARGVAGAINYEDYFGVQPPVFDPNMPVKYWEDDTPNLPDTVTYKMATVSGPKPFAIPRALAQRVNIPGGYRYEPWVYDDSGIAYVQTVFTSVTRHSLEDAYITVAAKADAEALADELAAALKIGRPEVIEYQFGDNPNGTKNSCVFDFGDDGRRPWYLQFANGAWAYVGDLLKQKYKGGVGCPGAWGWVHRLAPGTQIPSGEFGIDFTTTVDPGIVADTDATLREKAVPFPIRDPLPNEKFIVTPFNQTQPLILKTADPVPAPVVGYYVTLFAQQDLPTQQRMLRQAGLL